MRVLVLIATLLLSFTSSADTINLGQASKYGAFVKEDFTRSGSDMQGSLAVGRDLNITLNQWGGGGFEVGNAINDFAMGDGPSLVVGRDINKAGGGLLNIYQTASLPDPVMGDLVLGGTIKGNASQVVYANPSADNPNTSDNSDVSAYVDFDSAFSHLENLSLQLSKRTATSEVIVNNWSLRFNVDPNVVPEDGVYVFNVTQEMLTSKARSTWYVDHANMVENATVVFNVTHDGTAEVTLPQQEIYLGGSGNLDPLSAYSHDKLGTTSPIQILYNFHGASQLNLNSNLHGSILAPTADIKTIGSEIYGQVIGKSWQGNMQINYNPFDPVGTPTTPVPEPSTFIIFAFAFALMISRNKLPMLISKVKVKQTSCIA